MAVQEPLRLILDPLVRRLQLHSRAKMTWTRSVARSLISLVSPCLVVGVCSELRTCSVGQGTLTRMQ